MPEVGVGTPGDGHEREDGGSCTTNGHKVSKNNATTADGPSATTQEWLADRVQQVLRKRSLKQEILFQEGTGMAVAYPVRLIPALLEGLIPVKKKFGPAEEGRGAPWTKSECALRLLAFALKVPDRLFASLDTTDFQNAFRHLDRSKEDKGHVFLPEGLRGEVVLAQIEERVERGVESARKARVRDNGTQCVARTAVASTQAKTSTSEIGLQVTVETFESRVDMIREAFKGLSVEETNQVLRSIERVLPGFREAYLRCTTPMGKVKWTG